MFAPEHNLAYWTHIQYILKRFITLPYTSLFGPCTIYEKKFYNIDREHTLAYLAQIQYI
jgi:hypothetical protein